MATKQAIFFSNVNAVVAPAIVYGNVSGYGASTANNSVVDPSDISNGQPTRAAIMPMAGTLRNLYIYIDQDFSVAGNYVYTLMVNGASSGITVTIPAGATGNPVLGNSGGASFPVTAGDLISIKIDFSGVAAGNTTFAGACEFDPA